MIQSWGKFVTLKCKQGLETGRKKVEPTPKIDKARQLEEEELAKLAELKENLGENIPSRYTDADLMSFLRTRSLNVKEAEKLMKIDFNMRLFLQIEQFLSNPELPQIKLNEKYSVSGIIGLDKEGSLIRVINIGYSDIKGFISCISTMDHFKLFIWFLDRDRLQQAIENRKTGYKKLNIHYILNMEHLNLPKAVLDRPSVDTGLSALKLLQDHYHDTVKVVHVVNAPSFFSTAFKLFKPVIKDTFHQKIKVLGGDTWKEELLKHIDADVLPAYLGGKRVDSNNDPQCKELIGSGGMIDECYYPTQFLDPDDPDVICATVPSSSSLYYRYHIPTPGSIARWHIECKDNDIGLNVFLDRNGDGSDARADGKPIKKKEDTSEMEQLTPYLRFQCHVCPEVGSTVFWFKGDVVVQFDNSYSWLSSKDIIFKIVIEPPTAAEKNHINKTYHATNGSQTKTIN